MADLEPYELFVFILRDSPVSRHTFSITASSSISVTELREQIYGKASSRFSEGVSAIDLILWKLNVPIPGDEADSREAALDQNLSELATEMKPMKKLAFYFPSAVEEDKIHIIVQPPASASRKRPLSSGLEDTVESKRRRILAASSEMPPSTFGLPEKYHKLDPEKYAFHRPPSAKTIPLALLHEIFGQFVENVRTYEPTAIDNALVRELRSVMSATYATEAELCDEFRRTLEAHYEIQLHSADVGTTGYRPDGHARVGDSFVVCSEGKLLGKGRGDPEVQACAYFIASMKEFDRHHADLSDLFPCMIIYYTGPLIGFSGAAITDRVHLEALTTVYPLHTNLYESEIALGAARAFGAFREAFAQLIIHHKGLNSMPSHEGLNSMPPPKSAEMMVFPYRDHYTTEDNLRVNFTYQSRLYDEKLIFTATTEGKNLIIKFTKRYSEKVHTHCFEHGIAPKLYAINPLHGGWFMVVMEHLAPRYETVHNRSPPGLPSALREAAAVLHGNNFVHGDLRGVNLMFSQEEGVCKLMILDFDWAGTTGDARYPANVNTTTISRPVGVSDGQLILPEHDLAMIDQIVGSE